MDLYQKIQLMDRESLLAFLGEKLIQDVLMAYESAYGSVQKFAYEREILKSIVDEYLSSGEEQKVIFCERLEYGVPSQGKVINKGTDKECAKLDMRLRIRCFFSRLFHKRDIAKSLRRQYGITKNQSK